MQIGNRAIDHIVYCVHDLDRAIVDMTALLGVAPVFGGYHTTQGTKNALLNLGNQCYLELLAIDPENEAFQSGRWMGIDLLDKPQVTRWALKSEQLESDSQIIKAHNPMLGRVEGGSRKTASGDTLKWGIAMPLAEPMIDVIPFMTDWSQSDVHPTDNLKDVCRLVDITFHHPNPAAVEGVLNQLSITQSANQSEKEAITLKIECPNGIVEI